MCNDVRTTQPISVLRVGLKCGGSDGMSGITANPLLGRFSDYMAINGGTTVMGEVPEMFGAEHLLMARSKDKETFEKVVELVNDFKIYFKNHDQVIYENPSPGNKNGGITTLEDKSLGCTQKSGSTVVQDVLRMGERVKHNGLNLTSTPGNDLVAVTSLACAGCQMVLFTTGRGTPLGGAVPTIKISTNLSLAKRKSGWIDFDASPILSGQSIESLGQELLSYVIEVASGKQTKNEENGFYEIAIFKDGVTL
jgi:altronate hydrolase